ncbi:MAG: SHOCT domain-containing protein [Actinomycetota bacterium]
MPLLDLFWSMLWFFLFFTWIWIAVSVLLDIFRSSDLRGLAKAVWVVFVAFLPVLGVLMYLIVRGDKMHERSTREARAREDSFRSYVQEAAGSGASPGEEVAKLARLRDDGVISNEEFERGKAKALA